MAKIREFSFSDKMNMLIDKHDCVHEHRGYLGLSQAGHVCDRYLWLTLHDAYNGSYDRRVRRIFERGDWEEHRIVRDLASIGIEVSEEQQEISVFDGKVQGHIDGIIEIDGTKMLLEIKAVNAQTWGKLRKNGVEFTSPLYYVQMQLYMHYLNLRNALFVATNKDNEMRYWEGVDYNEEVAQGHVDRLKNIVERPVIPQKIGGPDWHTCKICSMYDFCHAQAPTKISCRSCRHMGSKSCMLGVQNVDPDRGCEDSWEDITR